MHTTLITPAELATHLDDPHWVIVDCRHDLMNPSAGSDGYAIGHIKGAVFANMDHDLSGPKHGDNGVFRGRHPLPAREDLIETLRSWGVSPATQMVAYDAHGGMFAARLWWLLRWVGHPAVAVLDGGLAAWQAQGLPMSDEVQPRARGAITDQAPQAATVTVGDVRYNVKSGAKTLVDARSPDRFRGENETMDPVGGHIPGAKNRFFKDNLEADGRFKSPEQLKADFGALIDDPANAIMQCGSGVTACHNLLALEVAGMPGAALYPGSWSEWCADPERPVATGPV